MGAWEGEGRQAASGLGTRHIAGGVVPEEIPSQPKAVPVQFSLVRGRSRVSTPAPQG